MFQSLALRGLILFVIANLVKAEVFVDDDIDAVIIQGNPFFILNLRIHFRLKAGSNEIIT